MKEQCIAETLNELPDLMRGLLLAIGTMASEICRDNRMAERPCGAKIRLRPIIISEMRDFGIMTVHLIDETEPPIATRFLDFQHEYLPLAAAGLLANVPRSHGRWSTLSVRAVELIRHGRTEIPADAPQIAAWDVEGEQRQSLRGRLGPALP